MQYVLYNPLANNNTGLEAAKKYLDGKIDGEAEFKDLTQIDDLNAFVGGLTSTDRIILAGGDGTINKFINGLDGEPQCDIDYVPTGCGNDFWKDVGGDDYYIKLNDYMKQLPTVTVNGKTSKFINGIGYGIDGYCCEVGDAQKAVSDKPVNYAGIAIKGVLFKFKPRNATVICDGVEKQYKKVWLAPTMNGRYYGGGMNIAPDQKRFGDDKKVTNVVWQGSGRLTTLMRFPKIFKGEIGQYTKMVHYTECKNITVKFDKPTALQIDGETVLGVTEYSVHID